jgi:hypothetical protein
MAIFKRKKEKSTAQKIRSYLWPSMGWKRTAIYYKHRIFRIDHSAHEITSGLATGAAVSWTPFLGTHILSGLLISHLFRFSLFASIIGTVWGNPWTFPLMFWLNYEIGQIIFGLLGIETIESFAAILAEIDFTSEPLVFMKTILTNPLKILLPVTMGSVINGLLFWPLTYAVCYKPVSYIHDAYEAKRQARKQQRLVKTQDHKKK